MVRGAFGRYMRERRLQLGMSQSALARAIGAMDRSYVTQVESGKIGLPQAEMRRKIAAVLQVSEIDLLIAAGELSPEAAAEDRAIPPRLQRAVACLDQLTSEHLGIVERLCQDLAEMQRQSAGAPSKTRNTGAPALA